MKVKVISEYNLAPDEVERIFVSKLKVLLEQSGRWVRDGHVWEDDPYWRHGSVSEVRVKYASVKEEKKDIAFLAKREEIRVAAKKLIDLLYKKDP